MIPAGGCFCCILAFYFSNKYTTTLPPLVDGVYLRISGSLYLCKLLYVFFQKRKAPARDADPVTLAFFQVVCSQETQAPARNAHAATLAFFQVIFSQETKAPARNAHPATLVFFNPCSTKQQKPLLGTLTRSPWFFSGDVFPRNKSPC